MTTLQRMALDTALDELENAHTEAVHTFSKTGYGAEVISKIYIAKERLKAVLRDGV